MPIPTANVSALVLPVAADVSGEAATGRATGTPDAGLFQATLVAASQPLASAPVGIVGVDEPTLPEETDDPTDAELAGLLAVAAQVLTPPVNAAVAQANGTAPQTDALLSVEGTTTRSRSDSLLLDRNAADVLPQATTPTTQPAVPATQRLATAPVPIGDTDGSLPTSAPTPAELTARSATIAGVLGQMQTIPAQAPIVVNLIPIVPVPADPSVTNPPVAAPSAAIPAIALPAAQLGERPKNAGEQFAAIASAGAQLVASEQPPQSVAFTNILAEADRVSPTPMVALPTVALPQAAPARTVAFPVEELPQESVPTARVRFATGDTVLPPVNFSTRALTDLGLAPVQLVKVATDAQPANKPTDKTADEATTVTTNAFAGPDRLSLVPAAPAATGAVRATPAVQVADAVVAHVQVLQHKGEVEFQMRLDPPELGRMQIRLVTRGNEIHGQVLVADEAVRRMIESQLPELRHRLEAAGVTVERFEVSTNLGNGGGRNPYREAESEFAPRTLEATIAPRPRAAINRPGALDVTV